MNLPRLLGSVLSLVVASVAPAQAPPPTAPPARPPAAPAGGAAKLAPPIVVEPAIADFGVVEPESAHPATFTLRNTSSAPVTIAMALPSCKCTTLESYDGKVIPANGSLEMKATLNAPATPGVKDAKVNVVIAGFNKPILLVLRCEVLLPIRAVEEFVDALKGVGKGVLTIESRDGKPFRIVSSNGTAPSFVGFDPAKDEPRSSYKVNWSVEGWPCEGMRLWWIIETDRPDCPILPCRIRHECTGIKADPGHKERKWIFKEHIVNAGRVSPGQTVRLRAEVENSEPKVGAGKPAALNQGFRQITSVRSASPLATAKLVGAEPRGNEETLVVFEFTVAADAKGMIYVPLKVVSATGEGEIAVVASVAR